MNYSPCISALYGGNEPLESIFADLRQTGFTLLECWTLGNKMSQGLPELLNIHGMKLTAFCSDFFILNDPSVRDQYVESLEKAIENAKKLGCEQLISQVGQDNGKPREEQHQSLVDGLRVCAPLLEKAGVMLVIEPLNTVKDHRGYYLFDSAEAFDIVREVGSPCVKVLYDVYHQLHMGEDVLAVIQQNLDLIGHFHLAGFPNRDEHLWDGDYDHRALLDWLKKQGVEQPIGIELRPSSPDARTLMYRELCKED